MTRRPRRPKPTEHACEQRARDYLKADLTNWIGYIRGGSQQNAAAARQTLQHWKVDPDLASVREADSLKQDCPKPERKRWQALWDNSRRSPQATGALTRRLSGEVRRDDIHPFRRGNTLRTSSQFSLIQGNPAISRPITSQGAGNVVIVATISLMTERRTKVTRA